MCLSLIFSLVKLVDTVVVSTDFFQSPYQTMRRGNPRNSHRRIRKILPKKSTSNSRAQITRPTTFTQSEAWVAAERVIAINFSAAIFGLVEVNGSEGDDGGDDDSCGNNGGISGVVCGDDGADVADLAPLLLLLLPLIRWGKKRSRAEKISRYRLPT